MKFLSIYLVTLFYNIFIKYLIKKYYFKEIFYNIFFRICFITHFIVTMEINASVSREYLGMCYVPFISCQRKINSDY